MQRSEITSILQSLTLAEKAGLCSGLDVWQTKPIPEKGVPSVWLSDGPHGLRKEDPLHGDKRAGYNLKATCFPPEATLAASWDRDLLCEVGGAIAEECLQNDVSVILGPGVNIKRSPLCGRNFEYYSEDPYLTGALATAMINGVQKRGVGACIKHFAVNNQEKNRMNISAEVDERALHELYLRAFETAVKAACPRTVMCSYNRINGVYASENKTLLTDILREKWGFDGLVMSDWGAVNDRVAGIKAGLDLEMPSSGGINDKRIIEAVQNGVLREEELDKAAYRVLCLAFDGAENKQAHASFSQSAHHALAVRALCASAVLLKNDEQMLPFSKNADIAVIGALAARPRYQGCGSSIINPFTVDNFVDAAQCAAVFGSGYRLDDEADDEALIAQALGLAAKHKTVLLFMGLTDIFESEGYDRTHLRLPQNQMNLLEKLAGVNPHIAVVLAGGSPVETPWLPHAKALLYTALGGEGVGTALQKLLYGEAIPSGKLSETWPLTLASTPAALHFPMGPAHVTYNESIYVGYRYYDKAKQEVRFPFGYGLSYTAFAYSDLQISDTIVDFGVHLTASFTITNIGQYAGEEIAQLYIAPPVASVPYRAPRTLAGFAKVALRPGEHVRVSIKVPYREFAFYDVMRHDFSVERGDYTVLVGPNSRELPLALGVNVRGEVPDLPMMHSARGPYGKPKDNAFPDSAFMDICPRVLIGKPRAQKDKYTMLTTLAEMREARAGRFLYWICMQIAKHTLHFSTDKAVNKKVRKASVDDLPFKNIALNSMGIIGHEASEALLAKCNGNGTWLAVLRALWAQRHAK